MLMIFVAFLVLRNKCAYEDNKGIIDFTVFLGFLHSPNPLIIYIIPLSILLYAQNKMKKIELKEIAEYERMRFEDEEKEELEYKKQFQRRLDEEAALLNVRNKAMLEAFNTQIELLMAHKKQGADIDKEIFAMREKLLVLERQENDAMVQDLLDTLDRI